MTAGLLQGLHLDEGNHKFKPLLATEAADLGNNNTAIALEVLEQVREVSPSPNKYGHHANVQEICGTFWETYKSVGTIGEGTSGVVKKAIDRKTQEKFAVKIVRTRDEEATVRIVEEFRRISRIDHQGVIKLHKLFIDAAHEKIYLLMEYFDGDTLMNFIASNLAKLKVPEAEHEIKEITQQIVKTLRYLHDKGVVHRDLTPNNILISKSSAWLTADKDIKIIDFNVAKCFSREQIRRTKDKKEHLRFQLMMSLTGTPNYRAPEIHAGKVYGENVDMWSLGCTMYKMMTNQDPFNQE